MSLFELLISLSGFIITTLIGVVGYMVNRQFNKLDKIESDFLDTKSKMVDISNVSRLDKKALIDHLEHQIMPKLQNNDLNDELHNIKTQLVVLKEFQMRRVEPILNKSLIMSEKLEQQGKKQAELDEIVSRLFEVVKKLVEKQKQP